MGDRIMFANDYSVIIVYNCVMSNSQLSISRAAGICPVSTNSPWTSHHSLLSCPKHWSTTSFSFHLSRLSLSPSVISCGCFQVPVAACCSTLWGQSRSSPPAGRPEPCIVLGADKLHWFAHTDVVICTWSNYMIVPGFALSLWGDWVNATDAAEFGFEL